MIDGTGVSDPDYYHTDELKNESEAYAGLAISVAGIGLGIASIPMFAKSHRLRKEATLNLETCYSPGACNLWSYRSC